ncbi:DUF4097 and DUF4098 domain-containing protein YvlB [Eubacterium ruminantium]|nr:DUF4097 and DUF4098 domain-containing protein YvlB [Eubacterium ruminantium]
MEKKRGSHYVAFSLMMIGLLLAISGFAMVGFNYKKLSNEETEDKKFTTEKKIENIIIKSDVADVKLIKTDDDEIKVEYSESKKLKCSISVDNGTLTIKQKDNRRWYEFIGFHFSTDYKINVYLPEKQYESVKVTSDTGSVSVSGFSIDDLSISVDTGAIKVKNVKCEEIKAETDTGTVTFTDVVAKGDMSVKTDTGSIDFTDIDAASIVMNTDTGSIKGTVLSEKIFSASTDTGSVNVPEGESGGKCKLTTDTGSINVKYSK